MFPLLLLACEKYPTHPAPEPRLGVLLVFDQLRAVDLERMRHVFGPSGFGGLEGRGAARYDARYRYAESETGPGHATLATGANPSVHGIISNYWFSDGGMIYAIQDKTAPVLGVADPSKNKGASAKHLRAGTLGDAMKAESAGLAKVITVSIKDRSAILSGGMSADLAIWYDSLQGHFTTSRAYAEELPPWIATLATVLPENSMKDGRWTPLEPPAGVTLPEDRSANEAGEVAWADLFPHDLAIIERTEDRRVAYRAAPQSMADTFAIAKAALAEKSLALGEDAVADLLVVSVSTTDYVGHGYGPHSLEAFDTLRRADREIRDFVKVLDRKLGRDGFVLALSSDHAATPLAELLQKAGLDAGRISATQMKERIDEALAALLEKKHPGRTSLPKPAQMVPMAAPKAAPTGADAAKPHEIAKDSAKPRPTYRFVKGFAPPHVFLDLSSFDEPLRPQAIAAARAVIEGIPGVATTYTPDELRAGDPDAFAWAYREALFDDRADGTQRHGVILIRQKARYVYAFDDETVGTDHGTPYSFDTTVPFIIMGRGVRGGRYALPCDVRDVSPTLAFLLRVASPDHAQGRPVSAVGAEAPPIVVP
ncbi:MAG: alkaline phosphatase family protein [Deltaproteobacteria bacterium]|nr:alkaline phosphatase family protein [Deltaproteobacteria bacterium]